MKTVLDIHGLSKNFDKQAILQDLHLTIREGDIYGLIGKNGAGADLVISGLGWIRVTGTAKVAVWAPEGVAVVTRKAII